MSQTDLNEPGQALLWTEERSTFIRLRTMILLRWVAICGQIAALVVAQSIYDLQLPLGLCYVAVGISVIGNLVASLIFPETKRLSEAENFLMVMFDLLQLCFLLYLTGGLNNPFSVMVLGPVTVSAVMLSLRSTIVLNVTAFVLISGMVFANVPLHTFDGQVLQIPDLFVFGQWVAIAIALVFLSVYSRRVTTEMNAMSDALNATQMALSRQQKLNDLGGVVAAAAHELGTPLATIKLTSAELIDDLDDRPDLQEDARLIREQADRCRDILRSMGRAGKDDLHLRSAPLSEVLREAAEPHENRGKTIELEQITGTEGPMPQVLRRPEVIHGLRNLVQNAVDFARSRVWIETGWNERSITVRIIDDGPGYPPHLLGRIGEPMIRRRRSEAERKARPEYEGMGLGLFIAKTLLERSGAELSFANASDPNAPEPPGTRRGAVVELVWPREVIVVPEQDLGAMLGENPVFEP
ncbi:MULTISPECIES: sensor histidine kinase RegB [Roseobacteraceae]|uniref:sensor histidine kinase RegB n=1 Tax=Roseobacteraceae TaxID=2854170 RepID=UPI00080AB5F2|nr:MULTISPECIES: ActS/PrrB/RegB family redox-sensitive histidine kinase [Roseobacteraceae]ANT60209.1 two-component sensor histidine kinase [Salipiger sp. CCB-MM3]MCA0995331.1 ActS/PrrB/RegB family redox-sensitive histidine kinase [Alloyangia pacifica]NDV98244.1 ActS/PrrB/RegB family redox-sensitive histidine kinase [Salipiger sp. PrR002]NDW54956.1 ActS/PrrB/RegB family redox-sensitive histidine kinase [Salipiger sp. PrR004]